MIKAVIRPGEQSGYVAECLEIPVVTQGSTLDEVSRNLREAVALHLEGEDLSELGLAKSPSIIVALAFNTTHSFRRRFIRLTLLRAVWYFIKRYVTFKRESWPGFSYSQ